MEDHLETIALEPCPFCGDGNETESRFCIHCGRRLQKKRRTWPKSRYLLLGVAGLALVTTVFFILMGGIASGLAGKVNGEGITQKEFSKRVEQAKKMYEYRYGQNLFEGEPGRENLNRLKTDILDEMVVEKILLQEAKNAGYTSAPKGEVDKRLEAVKKQYSLADEDFQKMGRSVEDVKAELGKEWVISQFVKKAVLKGDEARADLAFAEWLKMAKSRAKIETYEKLDPVSTATASCCGSGGSGGGGCGGGGRAQPLDPKVEKEAKEKGLEYYERKTQKKGMDARVTNFGCHIQIDIIENGKVVTSLTYNQGEVREI